MHTEAWVRFAMFAGSLVSATAILAADEDVDAIAARGYSLVSQKCRPCHGEEFRGGSKERLNFFLRDSLVEPTPRFVVIDSMGRGSLDKSEIWARVDGGDMPPEENDKNIAPLTPAEKKTLLEWITAGVPFPATREPKRDRRSIGDVLALIRDDLRRTPALDRPYRRYFTLHHISNNPRITGNTYQYVQAALFKVLNSVSWEPDLVLPIALDKGQTVYRFDLRDVGLDKQGKWRAILRQYPYGLGFDGGRHRDLQETAVEIAEMTETPLPYIRADWFIFKATQGSLYNTLTEIPENAADLERRLGVNVKSDFLNNKLRRAGFAESGVSQHNRVVDRHSAPFGYYWKSYDFGKSDERGNLFSNPLGPSFSGNPFEMHAFEHAGGEIIFSLPNGLQGYMLCDNKDQRLDAGPPNIVADRAKTAGTYEVVNAISCISCHQRGMQRFTDSVREGTSVRGASREKVKALFLTDLETDAVLDRDEQRFLNALERVLQPFLTDAIGQKSDAGKMTEPVGAISKYYYQDLNLDVAAAELEFEDPEELRTAIRFNKTLQTLGMRPLLTGATIKREAWETRERVVSPFQAASRELEIGTPLIFP